MNTHQAYMLLLLTLGAFVMPILAERIGWFAAPCEVLYGTAVGTLIPGAGQPGTFVTALSNFGFLLLLFLAGLDVDFTLLTHRGPRLLLRTALAAAGVQGIGLAIGLVLGWPAVQVLLVNALSVSLLLIILRQAGLSQSPFGQTLLLVALMGEGLSIVTLTGYDLLLRHGFSWQLGIAALNLLIVLVLGFLALQVLHRAVTSSPQTFGRLFAHADPSEIGVRAALALMMAFAALAVLLGVEQILATFVAGVVCSYTFRSGNRLFEKIATMGQGFFIPIFFISAGLGLQISTLLSPALLVLLLTVLVGTAAVRLLATPLLRATGLTWREAACGALLLAAPLTLQVAIVQVGVATGQVSGHMQGAVLGAAIVGAVLYPALGRGLLPTTARTEAHSERAAKRQYSIPVRVRNPR
jgi:Kef-type K+ transport system membrane component KefB